MTQFKKNNTTILIENPLGYEKFVKGLQAWRISLVDPYFLEHGWNDFGSSEESMMVQKLMLDVGCNVLEIPASIKFSQDQLLAWMDGPGKDIPLHPRGRFLFFLILP